MNLTLSEAAKTVKRSKQALALAIQKGRLSAFKDANGTWRVDSAELFRVYQPASQATDNSGDKELALLRERLAALEALHKADRELIDELRTARDTWQRQAETLLRALPSGLDPERQAGTPESMAQERALSGDLERPLEAREDVSSGNGRRKGQDGLTSLLGRLWWAFTRRGEM